MQELQQELRAEHASCSDTGDPTCWVGGYSFQARSIARQSAAESKRARSAAFRRLETLCAGMLNLPTRDAAGKQLLPLFSHGSAIMYPTFTLIRKPYYVLKIPIMATYIKSLCNSVAAAEGLAWSGKPWLRKPKTVELLPLCLESTEGLHSRRHG